MTTELTKAAQQAHTPEHIAGVDHAHELLRRQGYHRDGDYFINVNRRGAEAIHVLTISLIVHAGQLCALTQRPQSESERVGAIMAHVHDLYAELGIKWGDNPFLALSRLRPQAVPMTDEQRQQAFNKSWATSSDFFAGIEAAEAHHGITAPAGGEG